jgi:hypothetical protein
LSAWTPPRCPVPCGDPGGLGRTSTLPPPCGLSVVSALRP